MLYSQVSCILAAEAEAKKQLEEDRRKKIEIEKKQKLQQMASKRKSQKKKVVESKPTDSSTFSLFGKGVSTEQKEVVPALIETPKTTQHEVQSTPNKDISSKNKLFDWKAPKWSQDKSNPKAQVRQKEEESSKLGRVTDKPKANKDDELYDHKEASKSSGLWKFIIFSYVTVLLSSIIISQRGHICHHNNRYLSPLLLCPATELPKSNKKMKKIKMKKQSV